MMKAQNNLPMIKQNIVPIWQNTNNNIIKSNLKLAEKLNDKPIYNIIERTLKRYKNPKSLNLIANHINYWINAALKSKNKQDKERHYNDIRNVGKGFSFSTTKETIELYENSTDLQSIISDLNGIFLFTNGKEYPGPTKVLKKYKDELTLHGILERYFSVYTEMPEREFIEVFSEILCDDRIFNLIKQSDHYYPKDLFKFLEDGYEFVNLKTLNLGIKPKELEALLTQLYPGYNQFKNEFYDTYVEFLDIYKDLTYLSELYKTHPIIPSYKKDSINRLINIKGPIEIRVNKTIREIRKAKGRLEFYLDSKTISVIKDYKEMGIDLVEEINKYTYLSLGDYYNKLSSLKYEEKVIDCEFERNFIDFFNNPKIFVFIQDCKNNKQKTRFDNEQKRIFSIFAKLFYDKQVKQIRKVCNLIQKKRNSNEFHEIIGKIEHYVNKTEFMPSPYENFGDLINTSFSSYKKSF